MQRCYRTIHNAFRLSVRQSPPQLHHAALLERHFNSTPALSAASSSKVQSELERRIAAIPISRFRNFCIVAHVDHGKSTLSDRLLELTGTIPPGGKQQILDKLDVERERGITVKAQTCSMLYKHNGEDYLLHLVDTPGHVDFRAEVSRSYASCGGGMAQHRARYLE
jgi:translation factor GUF1, mitochondrial